MIKISFWPDDSLSDNDVMLLIHSLNWRLPEAASLYDKVELNYGIVEPIESKGTTEDATGGGFSPVELLIVYGASAGTIAAVFRAIHQSIIAYLEKDKWRQITIEKDGEQITLTGYKISDSLELINSLFPELNNNGEKPAQMQLDKWFEGEEYVFSEEKGIYGHMAKSIAHYFNLEELELMTSELGLDWENLRGSTKSLKALSLVQHVFNLELDKKLYDYVKRNRPNLDVDDIFAMG